jgi:hypothetical protein
MVVLESAFWLVQHSKILSGFRFSTFLCYYLLQRIATFFPDSRDIFLILSSSIRGEEPPTTKGF